jgi:hypothetical protein
VPEDNEAFCVIARQQIVAARAKLAMEHLAPDQAAELWQVIECIEALIKMRARCFATELEQIDRQLEERFRRTKPAFWDRWPRWSLEEREEPRSACTARRVSRPPAFDPHQTRALLNATGASAAGRSVLLATA